MPRHHSRFLNEPITGIPKVLYLFYSDCRTQTSLWHLSYKNKRNLFLVAAFQGKISYLLHFTVSIFLFHFLCLWSFHFILNSLICILFQYELYKLFNYHSSSVYKWFKYDWLWCLEMNWVSVQVLQKAIVSVTQSSILISGRYRRNTTCNRTSLLLGWHIQLHKKWHLQKRTRQTCSSDMKN